METDHKHGPTKITERLASGTKTSHLKDMICGTIDGAVATFAMVAGVEGAGPSSAVVIFLGLASILADCVSMAAINYSGTKAELDDRKRIVRVEERHLQHFETDELEELRQILAQHGLPGTVLDQATDLISADTSKWIDLMLTDEYGLSRAPPNPLRASLAAFVAFLVAGSAPSSLMCSDSLMHFFFLAS